MKEFSIVISDPHGIHARPAGRITEAAKSHSCSITVQNRDKKADAKRILALMSLGAVRGSHLRVTLEGSDEDLAYAHIKDVMTELLGGEA